ncbi:MAG: N-acetylneuraminate synthase family protein [Saprospiraceae bacterium]|nr:N-acetylneuraminate synthase family protein [Saprospiraceae bacterium]
MRPVLIAECCQNHNGNRDILKRMIHAAAENGADYVKIQAIRSGELTFRERFEEGLVGAGGIVQVIKRPFQPELERLSLLDLSPDDEAWFVEECHKAGALAITTAFTRSAVQEIKDMGYDAVKIASYDCASYPLLRDVKQYWNRIFVSTGATFDEEIEQAAQILAGSDFDFLHCVTLYPTPLHELHLSRMDWLKQFTQKVGYSDHSKPVETGLWASKIALALGASSIERHFTVLLPSETKDGPVSVNPEQLRELRSFADQTSQQQWEAIESEYPEWRETLGNPTRQLSPGELLNRDYYRGRFASKSNGIVIYNWEDFIIQ